MSDQDLIRQLNEHRINSARVQAEQLQRIADLERQNELLRAMAEENVDSLDAIMAYTMATSPVIAMKISEMIKTKALQAAIDGGALEGGE